MYWMKTVSFYKRLNKELVSFEDVSNKYDVLELKGPDPGACGIHQLRKRQDVS